MEGIRFLSFLTISAVSQTLTVTTSSVSECVYSHLIVVVSESYKLFYFFSVILLSFTTRLGTHDVHWWYAVAHLFEALRCKPEDSGLDLIHWKFSIT
jgi:hypothetical protein